MIKSDKPKIGDMCYFMCNGDMRIFRVESVSKHTVLAYTLDRQQWLSCDIEDWKNQRTVLESGMVLL